MAALSVIVAPAVARMSGGDRVMPEAFWRSVARTVVAVGFIAGIPGAFAQQDDAKGAFLLAIDAAGAVRDAALDTAQRDYDRVVAALETAAAALTADARRRLETGPLAKAERAHGYRVEAAQIEWSHRIDGAVRNYPPATAVWDAVTESVSALRADLEIYAVVTEAADFALDEASSTANAAEQAADGQARDVAALEARAAASKSRYEAADRAYQATVRRRPQEIEAEGFGAERLGAFARGLGALLGGDSEATETTNRELDDIFRAEVEALAEADAANEAAEAQYDDAVAEARAKREAAYTAYRTAADAVRRTRVHATGAAEVRESASRHREAAIEARQSSFLDAANVTPVHSATELSEVGQALIAGALEAIAELDAVALAGVSEVAARQALDSALEVYARPKRNAFDSAERSLAHYDRVAEDAHTTRTALTAAEEAQKETELVLARIVDRYLEAAAAADRRLDNSIVDSFGRYWSPQHKKARRMRRSAAADHDAAMKAAQKERRQAVERAFPGIEVEMIEPIEPYIGDVDMGDYGSGVASITTSRIKGYRNLRSRADARYKAAVLRALNEDAGDLRSLRNRARRAAAARETGLRARDAALARAEALVAFDEDATDRVRVLEKDVRDRLLATARALVGRVETNGARNSAVGSAPRR